MLGRSHRNFSVMLGQSHRFLGITSTFFFFWGGGGVKYVCSRTPQAARVGHEQTMWSTNFVGSVIEYFWGENKNSITSSLVSRMEKEAPVSVGPTVWWYMAHGVASCTESGWMKKGCG